MDSLPPSWTSAIFNTNAFRGVDYLTREEADLLYLSVSAGANLPLIDGITPGIVSASKAVIVDSLKDITGFNTLTSNTITSTTITSDTINSVNQFNCTGNTTYSAINGNITFSGVSSNIQFSGNASRIDMTGSGSKITLTGNNTSIELAGTGGHIDLSNTQASNNINTGALRCAGGCYFGNDCVFATQASFGSSVLNQTNAGYLVGISTGTVSTSKAVVVDINKDISGFRNLTLTNLLTTPNISITSSTDSTSISTGCLVLLGGLGVAKSLFVGGSGNFASTTRITGVSPPASGSGLELAFGSTISNIYSYNRSTSNYLDLNLNDKMLIQGATGDIGISSTTVTSSKTTGALVVAGGIGIGGRVYASRYTSSNNGSNYELINGANTGLLELAASPNIVRLVHSSGYAISLSNLGLSYGTTSLSARFPIDFQVSSGDIQILLYASTIAGSGAYGIGAASSAIQYHSAGSHKFYNNSLLTGSTVTPGTNVFNINTSGNAIASSGVHATGFSTIGLNAYGMSAHMHFGAGVGSFLTYNYSAGAYGDTMIGNNNVACCSNGFCNINSNSFTPFAPLAIFGSAPFTRLGAFGWLSSGGTGTSVGFVNRPFSIYSDQGIIVNTGEIDVFSDIRMKKDIQSLDEELCDRFIKNIDPIQFKYVKNEDRYHYGYAAQQLMAYGYNMLVGLTNTDEPLPEQTIQTYIPDPDGKSGDTILSGESIDLPSDIRLTVCLIDIIPMLHKCIQKQQKRLDEQQLDIDQLKEQISSLLSTSKDPPPIRRVIKKTRLIKL